MEITSRPRESTIPKERRPAGQTREGKAEEREAEGGESGRRDGKKREGCYGRSGVRPVSARTRVAWQSHTGVARLFLDASRPHSPPDRGPRNLCRSPSADPIPLLRSIRPVPCTSLNPEASSQLHCETQRRMAAFALRPAAHTRSAPTRATGPSRRPTVSPRIINHKARRTVHVPWSETNRDAYMYKKTRWNSRMDRNRESLLSSGVRHPLLRRPIPSFGPIPRIYMQPWPRSDAHLY